LVPVENKTRGSAVIRPDNINRIRVLSAKKLSFFKAGSATKIIIIIAKGVIKIVSNVTDEIGSSFTLLFIKP
tara:strand:+ start:724 stop:939 length:216 start_codon:yes stop_codon:yes gene_type:complete